MVAGAGLEPAIPRTRDYEPDLLPGNYTHGIGFLVGLLVVRVIDILRDADVRRFL
jgi:hypothetical protein